MGLHFHVKTGCAHSRSPSCSTEIDAINPTTVNFPVRCHRKKKGVGKFPLKIAQPFMAGFTVGERPKSRQGRQSGSFVPCGTCCRGGGFPSVETLGYFQCTRCLRNYSPITSHGSVATLPLTVPTDAGCCSGWLGGFSSSSAGLHCGRASRCQSAGRRRRGRRDRISHTR